MSRKAADQSLLQRYYDLKRLSSSGLVDADLEAQALSIEASYFARQDRYQALLLEAATAKRQALADIGKHFGALARVDTGNDVRTRFRRWWHRANRFRKSQLDGIALHGSVFDSDGPMFKAFMKAMGYRYDRNNRFVACP